MADSDIEIDLDDLERRMEGAMGALRTEFASLRTGRASATMLEPIHVEAYGQRTPINQVGTVNVPEPRMVTITIWDKQLVNSEKDTAGFSGAGTFVSSDLLVIGQNAGEYPVEGRIFGLDPKTGESKWTFYTTGRDDAQALATTVRSCLVELVSEQ